MSAIKHAPGDLSSNQPEQIKLRILIPLLVAFGLVLTIFGLGLYQEQRRANERSIARAAQSVERLLNDDQKRGAETLSLTLQELLDDDRLADALRDRNRSFLSERTSPLFENLSRVDKITHFCFYSRDRTTLLQKHGPAPTGAPGNDPMLLAAERTGQRVSGLQQSPRGTFILKTISPWRRDGQLLGYVELGVDLHDILMSIHQELQVDLYVAVDKAGLQRAPYEQAASQDGAQSFWDRFPAAVVTDKTTETIPQTAQTYLRRGRVAPSNRDTLVYWKGTVTQIIFLPLKDSEGQTLGELIVLRDISQAVAETNQWKIAIVLISLSVSAALAVFFYSYLGRIERTLAERTLKLREANEQLEMRVERRTVQLRAANAELQTEMTRRENAQQELVAAQKQLLDASRQAGKAEVASSVLHNVGNVLNSANVSASMVSGRLQQTRISNIARIAGLLQDNVADLTAFITHDPKGRQLLPYLIQLAEHLAEERDAALKELQSLRENLDHIMEIVATQQRNAKPVGLNEKAQVADLVEDALRMTNGSLSGRHIQISRQYEPGLPEITLDRHKVFQILANLIHNARYACEASDQVDKRLAIRVARENNHINIIVADNGIGIPPENLTRIFNHGFTTRKDGHGFGLHSGALAAREMGGNLLAQSDGPGRGATFTLQLPYGETDPAPP